MANQRMYLRCAACETDLESSFYLAKRWGLEFWPKDHDEGEFAKWLKKHEFCGDVLEVMYECNPNYDRKIMAS